MARDIPSYKRVVKAADAKIPETPRPLLAQTSPALPSASPTKIASDPMRKVLTTMEIRSRLVDLMWKHRYDPIKELMDIAQDLDTPLKTRVEIHMALSEYITPKLKSVDMQVQGEMNISVNVVKFSGMDGAQLAPNREPIPVRATEVAS